MRGKSKGKGKSTVGAPPVPQRPKRIIAERAYLHKKTPFTLKIFEPVASKDGACFCHVTFEGLPGAPNFDGAFGVDRLQALDITLGVVESLLRARARDLRIDFGGGRYGLVGHIGRPLTFGESDLLTESDRKSIWDLYASILNKRIKQRRRANLNARQKIKDRSRN